MIRLIQRRLIIPRGDTGSFTVPAIVTPNNADVAVFTIIDPRTRTKVFQKEIAVSTSEIAITFNHNETVNLPVGKYVWDIKYYKNPVYANEELVNGEEIDSYYAGYSLPECEIRPTGDSLLTSTDSPSTTLTAEQLNIISAALAEFRRGLAESASNVSHYPIIQNEEWYLWDATTGEYVATGVAANGIIGPTGNGIDSITLNNDYTLTIHYTNGNSVTTDSIRGLQGETGNGISDITLNNDYTLTITYTNGNDVTTGSIRGEVGPIGIGISSIEKTATNGLVDTYTITYTDGNHTTFAVTNGEKGDTGDAFHIVKTYATIAEMNEDYSGNDVKVGEFVMIASNVEDPDNAKVYVKGTQAYNFVIDMSGAQGLVGPQGPIGVTPALSVGSVTTLASNENATVSISGSDVAPVLSFGIPVGATPQLTMGNVSTLSAGSAATASFTGAIGAPVLNLGIPKGDKGDIGDVQFATFEIDLTTGNLMCDATEHMNYGFQLNSGYLEVTIP